MRSSIRTAVVFILGVALLAPLGVASAQAATSPGLSCSSSNLSITPLHTPTFFEDKSVGYVSQWIGYRINSTDVQATLSTPANSRLVSRTTNLVTTVAPGTNYSVTYALLEDTGRGLGLTHNITFTSGTTTVNCSFTFKSVIDAPAEGSSIVNHVAPANVSYRSATPVIYSGEQGNLISMTVDGMAGVLEQGSLVSLSPTPKVTWDSSIDLQLVSVRWRAGSDPTMKRDQLWYAASDSQGGGVIANTNYHVEYTFRVNVGAAASWQITPAVFVRDSISTVRSTSGPSAQFSVIDRPNSDFYTAVNHTFTGVMTVGGGTAPYNWTLKSGTLPEGLTLNPNGQITGVPTKIENQSVEFSVTSATTPNPTIIPIRFFIQDAAITTNLPRTVSIHKPMGTYNFKIAGLKSNSGWGFSGTIPPGTTFSNGTLSGTPTLVGKYTFTLSFSGESDEDTGKNSNGNGKPARKAAGQRTYTIEVTDGFNAAINVSSDLTNLSLGDGSPNSAVTPTDFGYATLYRNNNDCSTSGNPKYSNTAPDSSTSGLSYSTAVDPYKAALSTGFCVQADVMMEKPLSGSTTVRNVRLRFDFEQLESSLGDTLTPIALNITNTVSPSAPSGLSQNLTPVQSLVCAQPQGGGLATGIEFCLGDLTTSSSNGKISVRLPLRFEGSVASLPLSAIRIHIQVTSDTPEYDNNYYQKTWRNNGCGNGDQLAPGQSEFKNNAENSGGNGPDQGNCPDKFTSTGVAKKLTTSSAKSLKTSISQTSSKAKFSTTSSEDDEESEPESGFCYNGTFRNNGWGNGDQAAPGGSGPNNNAENNTSGKTSPLGSTTTTSTSSTDDGTDDGSESERYCDPLPEDYDNIAILWLTQSQEPENNPLPQKPTITLRDPDTSTIKSDVNFPPGFTPLPTKKYYVVTCYSRSSYDVLSDLDSLTASLPYLPLGASPVVCKVAEVVGTGSSELVNPIGSSQYVVSIPKPTALLCKNLSYFASTYLYQTGLSTPAINLSRDELLSRSLDALIDSDAKLGGLLKEFTVLAENASEPSCHPGITLKDPDSNNEIKSEVKFPPNYEPTQNVGKKFYAVTCYSKTLYTVISNADSSTASLPEVPPAGTVTCKVAQNATTGLSTLPSPDKLSAYTVSIPKPAQLKCVAQTYYVSTYLYRTSSSTTPDINLSRAELLSAGIMDFLLDVDPALGAGLLTMHIDSQFEPTSAECQPSITLQNPNNNENKIKSDVTFPPNFTPDGSKKYYVVTCYSRTTYSILSNSGVRTANLPQHLAAETPVECRVAQVEGSSPPNSDLVNPSSTSAFLVSIPKPAALLCKDLNYYASTYLFETAASATPTVDISKSALLSGGINDLIIDLDPVVGGILKTFTISASNSNHPDCHPGITLKDPDTTDDIKSEVKFPPLYQNTDKKYYAVTCYSLSEYAVLTGTDSHTSTLPNVSCFAAKSGNTNSTELQSPVAGSNFEVSIVKPDRLRCESQTYYVSTYLFATPATGATPAVYALRSALLSRYSDLRIDLDPELLAGLFVMHIPSLYDPAGLICNPPSGGGGGGGGGGGTDPGITPPGEPPLPAPTPTTPTNNIPPYTPIAQCATGSFCTPVSPARIETFQDVTGNQGRFVASAGLVMRPPGIPAGYTLAFPNTSIPEFKGKALFSLTSDGAGVVVTSDTGWTGFLHINGIAVAANAGGAKLKATTAEGAYLRATYGAKATAGTPAGYNFALDIQIYPDPSPKSSYVNTADGKSLVTWEKSPTPTTVGYEVYFNGVLACTTKATTCTVAKLVGPKSKLAIVAIGGKKTRSVETMPKFIAGKFAVALTVHYDTSKADLKKADIAALDKLITFIKKEGYKQVFVVGHTDIRLRKVNNALSKARAQSVIAYMAPRLKGVTYSGTADADKVPFAKGNSKKALALNRRSEIFVR